MGVTLARGARVYLDANLIIYATENTSHLGDQSRTLFRRFNGSDLSACTSELTIAEVLVQPFRTGNAAASEGYLRFFGDSDTLTVISVSRSILIDSARARASSRLKLADAIHVATALAWNCSYFLTNDHRLGTQAGLTILTLAELVH